MEAIDVSSLFTFLAVHLLMFRRRFRNIVNLFIFDDDNKNSCTMVLSHRAISNRQLLDGTEIGALDNLAGYRGSGDQERGGF